MSSPSRLLSNNGILHPAGNVKPLFLSPGNTFRVMKLVFALAIAGRGPAQRVRRSSPGRKKCFRNNSVKCLVWFPVFKIVQHPSQLWQMGPVISGLVMLPNGDGGINSPCRPSAQASSARLFARSRVMIIPSSRVPRNHCIACTVRTRPHPLTPYPAILSRVVSYLVKGRLLA